MFCILPIASDTAYITYSVNSHEDILGYISGHVVLDSIKTEQKCDRFFDSLSLGDFSVSEVCN